MFAVAEAPTERAVHVRGAEDDSVTMYLQEVGRIPLLTAAEEHEMARAVFEGREAGAGRAVVDLARAVEDAREAGMALAEWEGLALSFQLYVVIAEGEAAEARLRLIAAGKAAAKELVERNLRLVVSVARRYNGRGVPLADLIEEGNIGLMTAVERFDYRKGYRFSTYATWWIRQGVARAVMNHGRTVRLPSHVLELLSRVQREGARLSQELGRQPTEEEIAERVGTTAANVRQALASAPQPLSLDEPVGDFGEGSTRGELTEAREDTGMEEGAEAAELQERARAALRSLKLRERTVLMMRYGIGGQGQCSLEQVSEAIGCTRERVRQIELGAIRGLREQTRELGLEALV